MENLLREVELAVGYHAKSTISKIDILLGDDKLLGLIIDNLNTRYDYDTLRDNVQAIIDKKLEGLQPKTYETSQYELVSSEGVDLEIDKAIVQILNQIENEFVRDELIRIALAPKKMLRAKMFLKMDNNDNYQAAALIELFHLATLIQDDVIDIASMRRHVQTINSKFDDQTAILLSDYLLVHIGYMIGENGREERQTVKQTTSVVQDFYQTVIKDFLKSLLYSEREVTKITNIKGYEQYASNKTAKFFKVALISGLLSNNAESSIAELEAVGQFGLDFGLVFQKVDDLLDYNADIQVSGKDSRDAENDVNNFILLRLNQIDLTTIKAELLKDIEQLQATQFGYLFEQEIKYLIRRINE